MQRGAVRRLLSEEGEGRGKGEDSKGPLIGARCVGEGGAGGRGMGEEGEGHV